MTIGYVKRKAQQFKKLIEKEEKLDKNNSHNAILMNNTIDLFVMFLEEDYKVEKKGK